jgi:hypothetical protein
MTYVSTWMNLRTNHIVNVDRFSELDDALDDVGSTFWHGAFPVQITVTDAEGEVVAERQFAASRL